MFLQIEITAESFRAEFTREWLLVVVCVHMEGKVIYLMKRLVANGAFIGLLAAVCESVIFVVAFLMETFAAELADIRFVSGMDPGVRVQCR